MNISSDADTVAYYTPRFNGFQMGVSYSRSGAEDSKQLHDTSDEMKDIVAAAINYNQKHGDTGIRSGFRLRHGGMSRKLRMGRKRTIPRRWGGGFWVGFSGVTVGVGYVRHNEVTKEGGDELDRWDVGGRYTWGPNAVSLGYIHLSSR